VELRRYSDVDDFLAAAGNFLVAREAEHNLLLGVAQNVRDTPEAFSAPPYFATVTDGDRVVAVANGHELLSTVTGTGCMSSAITGCFLAVAADRPLEAAAEALVTFGVAGEDAAEGATGPGSFHANLYDALYTLDPATLDGRARSEG